MDNELLCFTPATELLRLMRARALSPVEIMKAVVARSQALNPALNFLCTETYDSALTQARQAEDALMRGDAHGLLHGLPVTLKDLSLTQGVRTMGGSFMYERRVPAINHVHVERLQNAGAISIGKTTVSELGWSGVSRSPVTGITHNPWKCGMNAGASSAGAGVGAAAGIGPLHQGSDGAGSVRMPAAFCGVYGLKPSFGRVPYHPTPNNGLISHVGPLTRTVADAALMTMAMAGEDLRDQWSLPGAAEDYLTGLDAGVRGLRVAYSPDLGHLRVDAVVAQRVAAAVKVFEDLGCKVDEVDPGWGDTSAMEAILFAGAYAAQLGHELERWADRMDPGLVALTRHGLTLSAADYGRAQAQRLALWDQMHALFQRYDLLLTPSLSVVAFPAAQLMPSHWPQHAWDWLQWAGFSYPFNLTGLPAATCPCGFSDDGLPIGLQIVAGRWQDKRVLQASHAFEQARPWAQYRPPV